LGIVGALVALTVSPVQAAGPLLLQRDVGDRGSDLVVQHDGRAQFVFDAAGRPTRMTTSQSTVEFRYADATTETPEAISLDGGEWTPYVSPETRLKCDDELLANQKVTCATIETVNVVAQRIIGSVNSIFMQIPTPMPLPGQAYASEQQIEQCNNKCDSMSAWGGVMCGGVAAITRSPFPPLTCAAGVVAIWQACKNKCNSFRPPRETRTAPGG
jgi:hypothetical protein